MTVSTTTTDAPPAAATVLRPMAVGDVDAVHAVERAAYPFPWSRGNFVDSLAAGYPAWVLADAGGGLLGYLLAMDGVDEMHLLNVTVAPAAQGRGHARLLIDALWARARERHAERLWLEVRTGNARARAIYRRLGFAEVGVRKGYYPAGEGRREDAIVMSVGIGVGGGVDALD